MEQSVQVQVLLPVPVRTFRRNVLLCVFVNFAGDTMSLLHEIDKSRGLCVNTDLQSPFFTPSFN